MCFKQVNPYIKQRIPAVTNVPTPIGPRLIVECPAMRNFDDPANVRTAIERCGTTWYVPDRY